MGNYYPKESLTFLDTSEFLWENNFPPVFYKNLSFRTVFVAETAMYRPKITWTF